MSSLTQVARSASCVLPVCPVNLRPETEQELARIAVNVLGAEHTYTVPHGAAI
jgi:hypothetical protein